MNIITKYRPMSDSLTIYLDRQGPAETTENAFQNGDDETFTVSVMTQEVSGIRTFEGMMVIGATTAEWQSVLDRFLPAKYSKWIAHSIAIARAEYDERFPETEEGCDLPTLRAKMLTVVAKEWPTSPDDVIVPSIPV